MLEREEDQNRAMEAAEPILPIVYRVLEDSVALYFDDKNYSPAVRAEHDTRAMTNCIYKHAEKRMGEAVDKTDGFHRLLVNGLYVYNWRDAAVFRLKMVKPDDRHSNYPTKQQRDYDDQRDFDDFPNAAYRLVAGYQLDPAGAALERVMVTRPIGRGIFWSAQVNMLDGAASWVDITPRRFTGTEGADFDAERARGNREK